MAGVIINPRGTSGSGKTELVRRIMAEYGWSCGAERAPGAAIEPLELRGRSKPIGYRLRHPLGDRPLTVLGHYERTSGGCDTIRLADGGLQAAVQIAREHACAGSDVLIEGLRLSSEHRLLEELARMHRLHVICLATPLGQCVANLMKRRRVSRESRLCIAARLEAERTAIGEACDQLMACAAVEHLDFGCALERIRNLVGLPGRLAPAGNHQHDCAHHG